MSGDGYTIEDLVDELAEERDLDRDDVDFIANHVLVYALGERIDNLAEGSEVVDR